jgi:hypothetical protein
MLRPAILALSEEHVGLDVRRRKRKRVAVPRVPLPAPIAPNERWSIDFGRSASCVGRKRFHPPLWRLAFRGVVTFIPPPPRLERSE